MAVDLPAWCIPFTRPAPYKCAYGGRSSSKTWTFAMLFVLKTLRQHVHLACVREFQQTLRESAKPALENAIARAGMSHRFRIRDRDILGPNRSRFFFQGPRAQPRLDPRLGGA